MNFELLTIWKHAGIIEIKLISFQWNITGYGHNEWALFTAEKYKTWEVYLFGFKIK